MSDIRATVKENLIRLRHENKLTQLELAQRINYSDKAVSRWETGEVTPDVETLATLADLYHVPVTLFFLSPKDKRHAGRERHAMKKSEKRIKKKEKRRTKAERKEEKENRKQERRLAKKTAPIDPLLIRSTAIFICVLCILWATIFTLFFVFIDIPRAYCLFIWGIPATMFAIYLYLLQKRNRAVNAVFLSILIWSLLIAIYVQTSIWKFFPIFFVGIPLEALILLYPYLTIKKQ